MLDTFIYTHILYGICIGDVVMPPKPPEPVEELPEIIRPDIISVGEKYGGDTGSDYLDGLALFEKKFKEAMKLRESNGEEKDNPFLTIVDTDTLMDTFTLTVVRDNVKRDKVMAIQNRLMTFFIDNSDEGTLYRFDPSNTKTLDYVNPGGDKWNSAPIGKSLTRIEKKLMRDLASAWDDANTEERKRMCEEGGHVIEHQGGGKGAVETTVKHVGVEWHEDYVDKSFKQLANTKIGDDGYMFKDLMMPVELLQAKNLLTQFPSPDDGDKVTIRVSLHPTDIIRKSTQRVWSSCERIGSGYDAEWGPMSDVEHWNAVIYVYYNHAKVVPKSDAYYVYDNNGHLKTRTNDKDKAYRLLDEENALTNQEPDGRFMCRWCVDEISKKKDIGLEFKYYCDDRYSSDAYIMRQAIWNWLRSEGWGHYDVAITPYKFGGWADVEHRRGHHAMNVQIRYLGGDYTTSVKDSARADDIDRNTAMSLLYAPPEIRKILASNRSCRQWEEVFTALMMDTDSDVAYTALNYLLPDDGLRNSAMLNIVPELYENGTQNIRKWLMERHDIYDVPGIIKLLARKKDVESISLYLKWFRGQVDAELVKLLLNLKEDKITMRVVDFSVMPEECTLEAYSRVVEILKANPNDYDKDRLYSKLAKREMSYECAKKVLPPIYEWAMDNIGHARANDALCSIVGNPSLQADMAVSMISTIYKKMENYDNDSRLSSNIRSSICHNNGLPEGISDILKDIIDSDFHARDILALNDNLPDDCKGLYLTIAKKTRGNSCMGYLINNSGIPDDIREEILMIIAKKCNEEIAFHVASSPDTPEDVIRLLLQRGLDLGRALVGNPAISDAIIWELYENGSQRCTLLDGLGEFRNLTKDTLDRIIDDVIASDKTMEMNSLLCGLSRGWDYDECSCRTMIELSKVSKPEIRHTLSTMNWAFLPDDVKLKVLGNIIDDKSTWYALANRRDIPSDRFGEILVRFTMESTDDSVIRCVANNQAIPESVVGTIFTNLMKWNSIKPIMVANPQFGPLVDNYVQADLFDWVDVWDSDDTLW